MKGADEQIWRWAQVNTYPCSINHPNNNQCPNHISLRPRLGRVCRAGDEGQLWIRKADRCNTVIWKERLRKMLPYKYFFLNPNLQVWERVLGKSPANKERYVDSIGTVSSVTNLTWEKSHVDCLECALLSSFNKYKNHYRYTSNLRPRLWFRLECFKWSATNSSLQEFSGP